MIQSCLVCKELNPKAPTNPNIDPEQPKTELQPFESVGLDMFSWKGIQYLLVVDRMSRYIIVENLNKSALCKNVISKFKLLCLAYGFPHQVRYNKGPHFESKFKSFLRDINIAPDLSSPNNPQSNGLAESVVQSAKILFRKNIEEKSNNPEMLSLQPSTKRRQIFTKLIISQ